MQMFRNIYANTSFHTYLRGFDTMTDRWQLSKK